MSWDSPAESRFHLALRCWRRFGFDAVGIGWYRRRVGRVSLYFTANTQIAPPSGTSGYLPGTSTFSRACIPRASTPQPDCTAMYCLPATMNDTGCPVMPELVGNSHTSFPVDASKAWNMRSLVPPLNTRPPAVASIGPQFCESAYLCVHTRL